MGMPLCCICKRNDEIIRINENQIKSIYPNKKSSNKIILKLIKIQSHIRGFLSKIKLYAFFNSLKKEISKELDKKKLVNEANITECESHKIYLKLISKNKSVIFQEQLKNNKELNNLYSTISKYSVIIPNYIVTSPNEVYKGSWSINKKYHGHGVKYEFDENWTKNKRIEGIFLDGLLFGQGIVIFSNGEIVIGNFVKNILEGNGEHFRKDKSYYKGQFKNGKYNGVGKEILEDGSVFEGIFADGQKKYGEYKFKNGSKYQGEFLDNEFHGKGKYTWVNKKIYDGNWKKGKMNGNGKFTYPNGSFYEGEFVDGKKCGRGKYVWDKERYYEGNWNNDKQSGYGVYYDKTKRIRGIWLDGKIINSIKKTNTFVRKKDSKENSPIKKGITQEYFYKNDIFPEIKNKNKDKDNLLHYNFNPTANGTISRTLFRNHDMYSIDSVNALSKKNTHEEDNKNACNY